MYIRGVSINLPENQDFDLNFFSNASIWKIQTWLRRRACLDQGEKSIMSKRFQSRKIQGPPFSWRFASGLQVNGGL
jgi:hypothetical protein